MNRLTTDLYGEERPLPYWVRLARIDGEQTYGTREDPLQTMLHLDLRGGEFTRTSNYRLVRVFDWLTSAFNVRNDQMVYHCLIITPLDPDQDFRVVDGATGRRPENWPARRGESFRWLPIPDNEQEENYAWQRR